VPVSYQRNHRGFTGHEHLDEWGLVNMNGRIYNPDIGRFLSADPYVQFPQSTQGLDRYAYVQNNPLSATDPSGHGILGILGSILSIIPGPWQAVGYAMIAVDGFLEGGLRGMVMSALSMAASVQVGDLFGNVTTKLGREALRAVTHGLAQGAISAAFGGRFGPAFLSASFSSAAGSYSPRAGGAGVRGTVFRVVRGAVIGGTASAIGGGKFANGAATGAFVQAFNHDRHGPQGRRRAPSEDDPRSVELKRESLAASAELDADEARTDYAQDVRKGNFGAGLPKCNLYTRDRLAGSGINPPENPGGPWPLQSHNWADSSLSVEGFSIVTTPERGDIVAIAPPAGRTYGYVGIVVDPANSVTVSARSGAVVRDNFGFDGKPGYVFRRYTGSQ